MNRTLTGAAVVALAALFATPAPAPLGPRWDKQPHASAVPQPDPYAHVRCHRGFVWSARAHKCVPRWNANAQSQLPQPEPGAHQLPQPNPSVRTPH